MDDIERNGYCFSDGNGPLSQDMANAIHDVLQRNHGRTNRGRRVPSVFQIRIQGAKGVLSVDPTLSGLKVGLRPSMVKFETLDSPEIEVARSFTNPGKLFLNRPLVMILAGLGVKVDVFQGLQQDAVRETEESVKTLEGAARLLERHGLGTAFAIPSVLHSLRRLGLEWKNGSSSSGFQNPFLERAMQFAVNHVLREMKYRARIPVPDGWKLVGVVDVHDILEPGQIYGKAWTFFSCSLGFTGTYDPIARSLHPGKRRRCSKILAGTRSRFQISHNPSRRRADCSSHRPSTTRFAARGVV